MFPSNASTFCRRIPTTTFSSANYLKINSVAATLIRLQPSSLPHQHQLQFGNVRRMGGVGGGAGFMEQYVQNMEIYMTNSFCSQAFLESYQGLASLGLISPTVAVLVTALGIRALTFPIYVQSEKLFSRRLTTGNIIRRQVLEKISKHYNVPIALDETSGQPVLVTSNAVVQEKAQELLHNTLKDYEKQHKISLGIGRIYCLKFCTFPIWLQAHMGLLSNVFEKINVGQRFPDLFWMESLSVADPYYILPVCVLTISFLNIWAHKWMYIVPEGGGLTNTYFFNGVLLFMNFYIFWMMKDMPAIQSIFWFIVLSTNLAQTLLLRHPKVKQFFGIGPLPTDSKTPIRDLFRGRRELPMKLH